MWNKFLHRSRSASSKMRLQTRLWPFLILFIVPELMIKKTSAFIASRAMALRMSHSKASGSQSITRYDSASLLGGDFAGMSATFNSKTGSLVRVPEHFVPPAMVEWGQIPSALEVITSEEEPRTEGTFNRWTITVLPEVGCGIDNLDTMKKEEEWISLGIDQDKDQNDNVLIFEQISPQKNRRSEICFSSGLRTSKDNDEDNNEDRLFSQRIRIGFEVLMPASLGSLITIVEERKVRDDHSGGTIADGGGLDGRTVSNLVGVENSNKPFSEQSPNLDAAMINGLWSSSNEISIGEDGDEVKTLFLPRNILVRYKQYSESDDDALALEISLFEKKEIDGENEQLHRTCCKGIFKEGSWKDLKRWEEVKLD